MLTAGSAQSDGRATCDGASEPDGPRWRLNAFGLGIEADFPIAGATDQPVGAAADAGLTLRRASRAELEPLAAQARMLRYLQTLTEIGVEKNTTIVFPLPIDIVAGFAKLIEKNIAK